MSEEESLRGQDAGSEPALAEGSVLESTVVALMAERDAARQALLAAHRRALLAEHRGRW